MSEQQQPATVAPASVPHLPLPPAVPSVSRTVLQEPHRRGRVLPVVVACLVAGVVAMVAIASRMQSSAQQRDQSPSLETLVSHANEALLHQRWDSPRGDNVRDITDEGLARWPHDPQLLRLRALASGDVVKTARTRRDEGKLGEALRLAKLAYQLDPSDELAQKLAAELESMVQSPPVDFVPPLANAHGPGGATGATSVAVRATLDASNAKPTVGDPVGFAAHVIGSAAGNRAKVEGAAFRVSGPGLAGGTQLEAADDGSGAFHAQFAFPQSGRFEVSFGARADGAPVRATRTIQVSQAANAPNAPPLATSSGGPAPPSPASSAKWL